jgi:ribosomal protein L29
MTTKTKITKAKEFDQMSSVELRETLWQLKMEKMSIEGKIAKGDAGLGGSHSNTRKSIARIMTILVKRGERCVA